MSVTCPDGHTSASTDYCDVCGAPIAAGTTAAPPARPALTPPTPSTCPHCGSPAASAALFCENCGYDFTTGATPVAATPPPTGAVPAVGAPGGGAAGAPTTGATPAVAAPDAPGPGTGAAPLVPPGTGPVPLVPPGTGPVPLVPPAAGRAAASSDPLEAPPVVAAPPAGGTGTTPDPSAPLSPLPADGDTWVAELWVDPDWYAAQQAEDPMPSVGLPVLVPLRESSVLVGRPSASRNIRPQVDAGADSGVSRRHCQLNTDGHRWWVEDLQSSNGTFVARVGEALPDEPIPAGQRHELQDGDRLYLGSWTRLVVRKALPGEV